MAKTYKNVLPPNYSSWTEFMDMIGRSESKSTYEGVIYACHSIPGTYDIDYDYARARAREEHENNR